MNTVSRYRVEKVAKRSGRPWVVLDSQNLDFRERFSRKRDALEAILSFEKDDNYLSRLFAMDTSGKYEWNAQENAEIDALSDKIRSGATYSRWGDEISLESTSIKQHEEDATCIAQWGAMQTVSPCGKRVCAEKRYMRAARIEAFKRAGKVL